MLYANTDDGSSALWVCDGNGVVVDNISFSIGERAPILEQINEHYGTSFAGWSDNEISLRLGDTLPNWDAYEKIEITIEKVIIEDGKYYLISLDFNNPQSNYMLGIAWSDGDYFALEPSQDGNELVLYNKEGERVETISPDWNALIDTIHNSIMEYNGQSVWIERDSTTPLTPATWERIP